MANPDMGRCDCPLCRGDSAVRETSKRKAYIVCENCGAQIFARGRQSDGILRGLVRGNTPAGETGKPAGAAGGNAPPAVEPAKKPAPAPAPKAAAVVHTADGERQEASAPPMPELTIFDHLAGILSK